jgi:hypothetical protein
VNLAHADVQRQPFEDFFAVDSGVEVVDFEHFVVFILLSAAQVRISLSSIRKD